MTALRCASIIAIIAVTTIASLAAAADNDCFERKDSRRLKFDVFQISAPPRFVRTVGEYDDRGPYYPATDYASTSAAGLKESAPSASGFKFRKHYLLWSNRCIYLSDITPDPALCRNTTRTKGNGYPSMTLGPLSGQLRTAYSTYAKANACTLISAMRVLGEDDSTIEGQARASDVTIVDRRLDKAKLAAMARKVVAGTGKHAVTASYLVDICVLDSDTIGADSAGILLDYEVFDNRTPDETLAFLRQMHDLVRKHGKTLIVGTNPLPRDPNGLNASNARDVLQLVDGLALPVASGATPGNADINLARQDRKFSPIDSYRRQLAVLTSNGQRPLSRELSARVIWNVSLHDTTLAEARQMHQEIVAQGYRGVMIFRNYTKQGGTCSRPSNQVTACLAFGECGGEFGITR